ncbi:hypothetical protein MNBD_GAMMA12-785 [hydrothermal vent metagenome]|uniref:Copper resistance protein D domain-containing protein n=1 Tax=hydrothermal vent metagenome TaxID=652676 RepID=A0A3B0YLI8_9ZZZZ
MLFLKGLAYAVHYLSAIIWIGGMFFAYVALRPAAGMMEPDQRLTLWARTLSGFFPWVIVAIILLYTSGIYLILEHKLLSTPIHVMIGLAVIMTLMFFHVYFAPFKRLKQNVIIKDWPAAGKNLAQIRLLVGINLSIGLAMVAIVTILRRLG